MKSGWRGSLRPSVGLPFVLVSEDLLPARLLKESETSCVNHPGFVFEDLGPINWLVEKTDRLT